MPDPKTELRRAADEFFAAVDHLLRIWSDPDPEATATFDDALRRLMEARNELAVARSIEAKRRVAAALEKDELKAANAAARRPKP